MVVKVVVVVVVVVVVMVTVGTVEGVVMSDSRAIQERGLGEAAFG